MSSNREAGEEADRRDYRWAGVDIEAADEAVEMIRPMTASTTRPGVMGGIGGFSALFELDPGKYRNPVLVSGTDGVGTKLELARMMGRHDTVGIDLVAMCVDDVVTCGAEPLFFQDYIATGKVVPERIAEIVSGIASGCKKAGCALSGGEIAEHPGVMGDDYYDMAGFCVGVVEKERIIDGSRVSPEDRLIGIHSSGLHSNGYSLVRKILFDSGDFDLSDQPRDLAYPLGQELLTPSHIYAPVILELAGECDLRAAAHITGGGITGNLARVLPSGTGAMVYTGSWPVKNIFSFIQKAGSIDPFEMLRTFNMGLGMILVVPPSQARKALEILDRNLYRASEVGEIVEGTCNVRYC